MTTWIYRIYAGVAVADKLGMNTQYANMLANVQDARTFVIPLVDANGNAVAIGTTSAITAGIYAQLRKLVQNGTAPASLRYWLCDAASDVLLATNHVASQGRVGSVFVWTDVLAAVGVQKVGDVATA